MRPRYTLMLALLIFALIVTMCGVDKHQSDDQQRTSMPAGLVVVADPVPPHPVAVAPRPRPTRQASRSRSIATPKPTRTHHVVKRAQIASGGRLYKITWYCDDGTTASGQHTHAGIVATASRSIPFGTSVTIDGLGTYVVEDRIGWGSDFDIWTSSCARARDKEHGAKYRSVRIG